jgi:membrane protease YdiL (CAAX protease family)
VTAGLGAARQPAALHRAWTFAATDSVRSFVPVYVGLIVASEAMTTVAGAIAGGICYGVVLMALFNHYLVATPRVSGRVVRGAVRVLPALALVPLMRLITLALALDEPEVYAWAAVGAPLLLAAVLAIHRLGLTDVLPSRLRRLPRSQARFALAGIPLGLLGFGLLRPEPLAGGASWDALIVGSVVAFVFGGILEELVFRGVVQRALADVFPAASFVWSSVLYAGTQLGEGPWAYVAFLAAVGLLFGWWVQRTGSIVGVALAHGVLALSLVVVWPFIL